MTATVNADRLAELLAGLPSMITEPGAALVSDALAIAVATDRLLRRLSEWQDAVTLYREWAGCTGDAEQSAVWEALPGDAAWDILSEVARGVDRFGDLVPALDLRQVRDIAERAGR